MLRELHVRDLGVIDEIVVDLGPGMTVLTGETGAGKTLIVEALELLLGGRADPVLVRQGAAEALVEGRFLIGGEEVILARAVPSGGRSRAWVDGRMAPVSSLSETGRALVDLYGQHLQQSLLYAGSQRRALDSFGRVDLDPLVAARGRVAELSKQLEDLGGDERARAREADLLRYQLEEIAAARISDPREDEDLADEQERLADVASLRQAAAAALSALDGERDAPGAVDLAGTASAAMAGTHARALATLAERFASAQADLSDAASELRKMVETWEDDPQRLAWVQARRQLLRDLSRKYGEGPAGVLEYAKEAQERLAVLDTTEERAAALSAELGEALSAVEEVEALVGDARRRCAPDLALAVERRIGALAMPSARFEVTVADEQPGDEVTFMLGANPGEPLLPLAKVASGGELARAMLALRLVLTDAPPTMVFDEVDAGVGGEAATAVGQALAEVGRRHQVLVVTHLPQVASFAARQIAVTKEVSGGRTVARVQELTGEARVAELARMLSGRPASASARRHAEELLRTHGRPPSARLQRGSSTVR